MLKLGELKISGMFVGDTKIKKAFLGTELVYEGAKPSRLPEGYTEVQYVNIQGNCGVPLGTTINPSTFRLVMDIEARANATWPEYIFACAASSGTTKRYTMFYRRSATTLSYQLGTSTTAVNVSLSIPTEKRTIMDLDWANKTITIDGTSRAINTMSYTSGTSFLFYTTGSSLPCKLYSAKIYKSGVLQKELVPCVQDSSGAAGLYDLGSNVFRKDSGGNITAGPSI